MQFEQSVDVEAPLWRRIELALSDDIEKGTFQRGEQLPSESELAQRFGVNRHTVRRSIASLVQKGAIRIERGRGSFVQDISIQYPVGSATRVEENLLRQHRGHAGRLLGSFQTPAPVDIARNLELRPGASLVVLDTLNESDGVPVSLVRTYLPSTRFSNFAELFQQHGNSMTTAFQKCGVTEFSRRSTRIDARMPAGDEVAHLKIPHTTPLLVAESVDVDEAGVPIKFGIARFPGGRMSLVVK
jgi:GntR family phosphonate transport system transcriptional regulator